MYEAYFNSLIDPRLPNNGVVRYNHEPYRTMPKHGSTFSVTVGQWRYRNWVWMTISSRFYPNVFWAKKLHDENEPYEFKLYAGTSNNFTCFSPALHENVMYFGAETIVNPHGQLEYNLLCQRVNPSTGGPIKKPYFSDLELPCCLDPKDFDIVSVSILNGEIFITFINKHLSFFEIYQANLQTNACKFVCRQTCELTSHVPPTLIGFSSP